VRRLYEDIHQVRIIARDVRDLEELHSTASLVLWATIRLQKNMEDYLQRNFYEHPSISAVIACHLAANHTKPDSTMESRVHRLEESHTACMHKLDKLESRVARLKQKNDITPPKGGGRTTKRRTTTLLLPPPINAVSFHLGISRGFSSSPLNSFSS
jgi:hypothetical protein